LYSGAEVVYVIVSVCNVMLSLVAVCLQESLRKKYICVAKSLALTSFVTLQW